MAEAPHAGFVANGAREGLAKGNADVLDGVVAVNVQVALRLDFEVQHAVARDLIEHVLEEGQAGGELGNAPPVQVELHPDLRFLGVAGDFGGPHFCRHSRSAATSIRFSSGVPTVMRRQSLVAGPFRFFTSTPRLIRPACTRSASGTRIRMKFACEGNTVAPGSAASAVDRCSRSTRICSACASSTSSRSSRKHAAACVSTFTLYGERTLFSCAIHSGLPAR